MGNLISFALEKNFVKDTDFNSNIMIGELSWLSIPVIRVFNNKKNITIKKVLDEAVP